MIIRVDRMATEKKDLATMKYLPISLFIWSLHLLFSYVDAIEQLSEKYHVVHFINEIDKYYGQLIKVKINVFYCDHDQRVSLMRLS